MEIPSYRYLFNEIEEFLGVSQWLSVLLRMSDSDHSFNCHGDCKGVADTQLAPGNRHTLSAFSGKKKAFSENSSFLLIMRIERRKPQNTAFPSH